MVAFIGQMVDYYKQQEAKKFLVYGQLMRPLEFHEPSPMVMLPYSSYMVRTETKFPAITSGVFRAADGDLGIFVVNASDKKMKFQAEMDLASYGVPAGTKVNIEKM